MDEDLPTQVRYWLNDEATHDCFFCVGLEDESAEKIGAIKAFLMGYSEPFRVMLGRGELAETKDIRVKDVEPETFRRFLACVYGASSVVMPKLTFDESAKLLYIIEKYLVDVIKPEIIDHMERLYSLEHLFDALSHPVCFQTAKLKEKMLVTLKYEFEAITKDDKFLKLSSDAITWILQQEPILVNEIEIWNAVLQWAKHNTGSSDGEVLRSCIYGFLKYIRFLTMDCDKFLDVVASTKILLEDEINEISKALAFNKPCSIEHLCGSRFSRYNVFGSPKITKSRITKFPCQAFIHCIVSPISTLRDYENSETHFWADHFWSLSVRKKNNGNEDEFNVIVTCHGKSRNWNCAADVTISIINQSGKRDKNFTKTKMTETLGLGAVVATIEWDKLVNSDSGFLKDGSIIVQARIQLQDTKAEVKTL